MLQLIGNLLDGLCNTDGVQSILSQKAFESLMELIETVYGAHAAGVVREQFTIDPVNGSATCHYWNCRELFESCILQK